MDAASVETSGLSQPTSVAHYRTLRPIGKGGMGSVFLARDTRLGRLVALKFLSRELTESQELRAQFAMEARATASLSHPNVVTVYDVGEHEGLPWVALEYIEGMTLAQRLKQDWPNPPEALRIGLAIARAIEAAHAAGVVHRDLKPANVLLGKDGRTRVVDFGVARFSTRRPGAIGPISDTGPLPVTGTPSYMAPEQWDGLDGPPTDIWALGLVIHLLLSRKQPLRDLDTAARLWRLSSPEPVELAPELELLAPGVAELLGRCLAKNPEVRPTASEVVAALLGLEAEKPAHRPTENPFRGLSAFDEKHAHLFFGRESEIAAFVERLRESGTMVVVGTSGAGKSSFLMAGVIPRLREAGQHHVLVMRPQTNPIRALAEVILRDRPTFETDSWNDRPTVIDGRKRSAVESTQARTMEEDVAALEAELRANPDVLAVKLADLAASRSARVVLVIDQLEEVVTVTADAAERRAFLEALGSAGAEPNEPVRIIMTVRDDFLGRIPWGPHAPRILSSVLLLAPPEPDSLREIVQRPLAAAGFAFDDPQLLEAMIQDVRGESARLPLLQFALSLLWARRDVMRSVILRVDYERMGGVGGALATHAEDVFATLSSSDIELCRALLLRLVTDQRTRRARSRTSLTEGLGAEADTLVTRLVDARLLSIQRGAEALIELAHESLTRVWPRLSRWIEESHEDLSIAADLISAAERWERLGKRPDDLWSGEALRDAVRLRARDTTKLPASALELIRASEARDMLRAKRRRLSLAAIVGGALLAATASTMAAWALRERQRDTLLAARQADEARARLLEERALASFASGEHHLARAQLRAALEARDSLILRNLAGKLSADPALLRVPDDLVYDALLTTDGRSVVTARQAGTVEVVDAVTLERRVLRGHKDQVMSVVELADGRIASSCAKGDVFLWDPKSGGGQKLLSRPTVLALAAQGNLLVVSSEDSLSLVDTAAPNRRPLIMPAPSPRPQGIAFSPSGTSLFVGGDDGRVFEVDIESGALLRSGAPGSPVRRIAIFRDRLFVTRKDGYLTSLALSTLDPIWNIRAHEGDPRGLVVSKDGRLFTGSWLEPDVVARDPLDGRELFKLRTRLGAVMQLTLSRQGNTLVASGGGGTELVDLARHSDSTRTPAHTESIVDLHFTADGGTLVSASGSTLIAWDVARGVPTLQLARGGRGGRQIALDQATGEVYVTDRVGGLSALQLSSRRLAATIGNDVVTGGVVDFDPLSGLAAVGTHDGYVLLAKPRTRSFVRKLRVSGSDVRGVFVTRGGGGAFAASIEGALMAFNSESSSVRTLYRHPGRLFGLAGTPDGKTIFLSSVDGMALRFDIKSGRTEKLFSVDGRLQRAALSPDGRTLAFPSSNGRVYLFTAGEPLRSFVAHRSEANAAAFDPTGKLIAVGGDDQTVRLFEVSTGRPLWRPRSEDVTEDARLVTFRDDTSVYAARHVPGLGRVVSYDHGLTEIHPTSGRATRTLRDVPNYQATMALAGPRGTVALGFPDGTFGLWDAELGIALEKVRLHGGVVGLRIRDGQLIGASELGDSAAMPLNTLQVDYCELLNETRRSIPYSWRDGAIVHDTEALPCNRP